MVAHAVPMSQLLSDVHPIDVSGKLDTPIDRITHDSRLVGPGTLFVAYMGVYQDVHRYLPDAIARGAAGALVERSLESLRAEVDLPPGFPVVQVRNARRARSAAAAALYGHPSQDMTVVGITGTDGKTTTSTLVHAILTAAGIRAGLVSTVAAHTGTATYDTGLHVTTPEAEDLHSYLADMRAAGVAVAVLEVTSHGLAQDRVTHVRFDVGAITNITHEALEFHETFEAYRRAKVRLFHLVATSAARPGIEKTAVLNAGDPSCALLSRIALPRRLTYRIGGDADFTADGLEHSKAGLSFVAATPCGRVPIASPLLGHYNASNILAALAVAHALNVPSEAWPVGVAAVRGIPGRMEIIDAGQDFLAVVDFAHTPNALRHALDTARELLGPAGRLILVFGCAGLRDTAKRTMMGRAAGEMADLTYVTAEDPRSESLETINAHIVAGLRASGSRRDRDYRCVPDRFEAIRQACAAARPHDVVIVTGKGHEQSMCFGSVEYPWDDRQAVRAALGGASYGQLPTATGASS